MGNFTDWETSYNYGSITMPGEILALSTGQAGNLFVTYRRERTWWQFWKPRSWVETREFLPGEL